LLRARVAARPGGSGLARALAHRARSPGLGNELDGKRAPHVTHCDLCLAAAALGSGAPAPVSQTLLAPAARAAALVGAVARSAPPALVRAYRSRAPPLTCR